MKCLLPSVLSFIFDMFSECLDGCGSVGHDGGVSRDGDDRHHPGDQQASSLLHAGPQ